MRSVRLLSGRVTGAACFALHASLFRRTPGFPRLLPPRSMVPWFGPGCFHGAHGTHAPFILERVGYDVSMLMLVAAVDAEIVRVVIAGALRVALSIRSGNEARMAAAVGSIAPA